MNERLVQILQLLIKHRSYNVQDLEKQLHLSRRQVTYTLKQLDNWLEDNNLQRLERTKKGNLVLSSDTIRDLASYFLNGIDNAYYSEGERIDILVLYLGVTDEWVSLNHLVDVLRVSKNTVINDIKSAKEEYRKKGVTIDYSRGSGYELKGNEGDIRSTMLSIVRKNVHLKRETSFLDQKFIFKKDEAIHIIREVEKALNLNYSDEAFDFLLEELIYHIQRMKVTDFKYESILGGELKKTKEYAVLNSILAETFLKKSLEWITLLFVSSNVYEMSDFSIFMNDNQILFQLITGMVDNFEKLTLVTIEHRSEFEQRLYTHLRSACFRVKYDIEVTNISINEKELGQKNLRDIMDELIKPVEIYLGKAFPKEEIDLLTLYFGSQLVQNTTTKSKKRAVVVCSNGLVVSRLMLDILKKLFNELHFMGALSVREFMKFEDDYDLVFTSVPLKTRLKQYVVSPIMTDREQVALRYKVLSELGDENSIHLVNQIMDAVIKDADVKEPDRLRKKIERILFNKKNISNNKNSSLPGLKDLLKVEYIQLNSTELDWRSAIKQAFEPLVNENVVSPEYVNLTIQEYEMGNESSFFGQYTAIPHADARAEISKNCIGLFVSEQPIIFPGNKEIFIIAPIGVNDPTTHLRAINELADITIESNDVQKLRSLKEAEEVYCFVKERGSY